MAIDLPMRGGCGCGHVRYEVRGQPLLLAVCHCTTCQKRTGSAFAMNLITPANDFAITAGKTVYRNLAGESGRVSVQHFCDDCLMRTHTAPANPDIVYVRPGTLDDPRQISPIAQIWTRSARPEALVAGVRSFETGMDDHSAELIRAWRSAHPIYIAE